MMHKAWSSIEEVSYYFSRSSTKFQGHTGQKIADFDQNWVFPDCNSSLNSWMTLKWCSKLDIVWKMCPIVFQGHPSNFKATWAKKIDDLDPFLSKITGPVAAIKSLRFALFSGHPSNLKVTWAEKSTIWIQNWSRLLGRSQLWNPSDLPQNGKG